MIVLTSLSFLFLAIVVLDLVYLIVNQAVNKGSRFFYIVPDQKAMVIERLGRYNRVLRAGLHFVIPHIEKPRKIYWHYSFNPFTGAPEPTNISTELIDLKEFPYDLPQQLVITKDNAQIAIDVFIVVKILDPRRVIYAVENFPLAIEAMTKAGLRNLIGGMELDETLTSRPVINAQLHEYLKEKTQACGVSITSAEITDIIPSHKVSEAMNLQAIAERKKRSVAIQGDAEAAMLKASKEVLGDSKAASNYLATLRYVNAFRNLISQKDGKVVFIPYESSHLLGALGSIRELFESDKPKPANGSEQKPEDL